MDTEHCFHFFVQILPRSVCQQYCNQHYKVITVELEQNNYGLGLSLAGAKVDKILVVLIITLIMMMVSRIVT